MFSRSHHFYPLIFILTPLLTIACGGGSGPSGAPAPITAAPTNLAYSANPATYRFNKEITPNIPSNSGGIATAYSVTPPLPLGLSLNLSSGVITGLPSRLSESSIHTVTARNSSGSASVQLTIHMEPEGSFSPGGNLFRNKHNSTCTDLGSGKLLLAGGNVGANPDPSALCETYGPTLGLNGSTGAMTTPRIGHADSRLLNGKVLISGGWDGTSIIGSAELYDPVTGTFSPTGAMAQERQSHTSTLLPSGKVLIAGGRRQSIPYATRDCELYDPGTGSFSPTGRLNMARYEHSATLLPDGKVLIIGGVNTPTLPTMIEIYDPVTENFSPAGSLLTNRVENTATLLNTGKVLITGGHYSGPLNSAEIYDPATRTSKATGNLTRPRSGHRAALLANGMVLIAGGGSPPQDPPSNQSCELFDPRSETFSPTADLLAPRLRFPLMPRPDGKMLAVGGNSLFSSSQGTVEVFQ